jgi:hypothetical protein
MRIFAVLIMVTSLVVGIPVMANDTAKWSQDVTVSSIQVVDIEDLPSDVSEQINEHAADMPEEELQSLRNSIDATPQAVAALTKKERTSAQVVAIAVDENGVLTIFTRRPD